jgi:II/X family phage/plasmid replication protein
MRDLVLLYNDIEYKFPPSLLITEIVDFQKRYERETGRNLVYDVWKASFKDIFSALEGQEMNIYDDEEVMQKLKHKYFTVTQKGNITYSKAHRVFGLYRRFVNEGYDNVRQSLPKQTFYRQLDLLLDVGISKAQLQNLTGEGATNVVPMIRFVDVDFSKQYPDWYVEPISRFVA